MINFEALFEQNPGAYLVLEPNSPQFTIVAVTDAYLTATNTQRANIVGHPLFEIFPDNPNDQAATGVANLTRSLNKVIDKKQSDQMGIQKYDIPLPDNRDKFEVRYWSPHNYPILDEAGNLIYILHAATDVTAQMELQKNYDLSADELAKKVVELEKINNALIGRELRMIELKKENAQLKSQLNTKVG